MSDRLLFPEWPFGGVDRPTVCVEESKTRQSEMDGADINFIMKRAEVTGVLPAATRELVFADVSMLGSFQEAQAVVQDATEAFMKLPSKVRTFFENDPVRFLDFCGDPANLPQLRELGLVEPEKEVVAAPAAAPAAAP